jgi:hypothetical protein
MALAMRAAHAMRGVSSRLVRAAFGVEGGLTLVRGLATNRQIVEERIKKMLELERVSGDVQAQLRQSRRRNLPMPAMDPELVAELESFGGEAERHPDFVGTAGGEPLIEREGFAIDKYRSLRLRMGSEGPCCHRKYLHALLDE